MDSRILVFAYAATLASLGGCKGHEEGGPTTVDTFDDPARPSGGRRATHSEGSGRASGGNAGSAGSAGSAGQESSSGGAPAVAGPSSPQGGESGTAGAPTTGSEMPATGAPGPRFIGRFTSEGEFAWSGSAIELRFTGSDISVTLDDWGDNYFEIIIDGAHSVLAARDGTNTYQLASNLAASDHELLLYRRTEAYLGPSQFLGFSVPESAWLPSRAPAERRIEIVADSTAVGYGVEAPDHRCSFAPETENSYLAYGEITTRALGAEARTLAWSGIGVYRDNSGNPENNMRLRYDKTVPTDQDSSWDFRQWVPQAVVVNLGANDFVKDDPGQIFEASYGSLLDEIRSHYPEARIYCAVGSSTVNSEYPRLKPRIEAIVAARSATDARIAFLDFGTTDDDDSYACDWHPSVATHETMAAILTRALQQDLGW